MRRCMSTCAFQSTPPVKAATFASNPTYEDFGISIHAAREGGDVKLVKATA